MQPLGWYVSRLRKMSPAEILWRVGSLGQQELARARYYLTGKIKPPVPVPDSMSLRPSVALTRDLNDTGDTGEAFSAKRERVLEKARRYASGRLDLFNLEDIDIGTPPRWHYDFYNEIESEKDKLAFDVDYRNVHTNGDCKLVWEPNRHHHIVVMALAFNLTREKAFAEAVYREIESWLDANPFGFGMNWRSPLELGVRLINWVWAMDLIREAPAPSDTFRQRFLASVYLHVHEVSRHYSRGSSANNHLIGEAAGVYVATSYFADLPDADRLKNEARDILELEIDKQSFADGCTREHAIGYQFFVLQFYLACTWVGKVYGDEFSPAWGLRMDKMIAFVEYLGDGGPIPMFGDQDDGYVLDLGEQRYDPASYRALFDCVFAGLRDADNLPCALFPVQADQAPARETERRGLTSRYFEEAGYVVLQAESADCAVSAVLDVAELGYGEIAAHGHADALSISVRMNGHELLVDTGTYDYFSHPDARSYFRSTAAHNTVEVDGLDQSTMSGPFMWDDRAEVSGTTCSFSTDGGTVSAGHGGYGRLADPVRHEREVRLSMADRSLVIIDRLVCEGTHSVCLNFHFSELAQLTSSASGFSIKLEDLALNFLVDSGLSVEQPSDEKPGPGWRSEGYHRLTRISTVRLATTITGSVTFENVISW